MDRSPLGFDVRHTQRWWLAVGAASALLLVLGCGRDYEAPTSQNPEPLPFVGQNGGNQVPDDEEPDVGVAPDVVQPTGAIDGAPCESDEDCRGGTCLLGDDYPDGYCTTWDCASNGCDEGSACGFVDAALDDTACFNGCDEGECRDGYACTVVGDATRVCLPAPDEPSDRFDGEPCERDDQCAGGTCLGPELGFPGGHCTTVQCDNRDDCAGTNRACLLASRPSFCIQLCDAQSDCRDDYVCEPIANVAWCAPDPLAGQQVPGEGELPFALSCAETLVESDAFQPGDFDAHEITFDLPNDTTSFMSVTYNQGSQLYPVVLDGPDSQLDLFDEYDFALFNSQVLINISPLLVPMAPQFAETVRGGEYRLSTASEENVCNYVLTRDRPGNQVDLNVYFVDVRGISASSAPLHSGFQTALNRFEEIYGEMDVSLGEVRFNDIEEPASTRFSIIRSQDEVFELMMLTEAPGDSVDEHLSINVFFIDGFEIPGGAVLGISSALPGPAGLHGTRGSGLVFSADVFGDPDLLGQVLAHEVGHYLGLLHTSEEFGRGFDPIEDTPRCRRNQWNNPMACPDIENLMFPFAGNDHSVLSEGQRVVLHANPLVKE